MPSHSVQNASHPVGASLSRNFSTRFVNLSHTLSRARHFNYLQKTWLKRKPDQADADLAKKEAERLKMEKEINEQVAARLKVEKKEKVEKKFDPNIALAEASA